MATSATVEATGLQVVSAGGVANATVIDGGGSATVLKSGTASGTIIRPGGVETVSGTDVGARISAGEQDVFGLASGATIFVGGDQSIESGGTASGTTVLLGGAEQVFSGAVAVGTVVSNLAPNTSLAARPGPSLTPGIGNQRRQ